MSAWGRAAKGGIMVDRDERIRKSVLKFYRKNDPEFIEQRRRKRRAQEKKDNVRAHPLEDQEHQLLVRYLYDAEIYFMHVPNEGKRTVWEGRKMFGSLGALKGAADIYVFERLPSFPSARGLAIELKRVAGSSPVWGRPEQHEHLNELADRGWKCFVARGHRAALAKLSDCGLMEESITDKDRSLVREFKGGTDGGPV